MIRLKKKYFNSFIFFPFVCFLNINNINNYWNAEESIRFIKGLDEINEEIDRIQKNLLSQSEKIKTASRHMKIAEEEAEKIAKTRDTE